MASESWQLLDCSAAMSAYTLCIHFFNREKNSGALLYNQCRHFFKKIICVPIGYSFAGPLARFYFVTNTYKVRVLVAAQQGSKQVKNAPTLNFPMLAREVEGWSVFCLFASLLYTAAPEPSLYICVIIIRLFELQFWKQIWPIDPNQTLLKRKIFIFCRIELIFGRLTCFDMKSVLIVFVDLELSTLQVATISVAMATRIMELATKLERKSPARRLKLTWPMRQELERTIIRREKKNVLSIKNSLCKASCCGILTNRNGGWIKWNVTR